MSVVKVEELGQFLDQETINESFAGFFEGRNMVTGSQETIDELVQKLSKSPDYARMMKLNMGALLVPMAAMCAIVSADPKAHENGPYLGEITAETAGTVLPLATTWATLFYMAGVHAGLLAASKNMEIPEEVTA